MKLENIYFLAEIVASLAVLISLVYLAIQVKHSNLLSQEATRHRMMELGQEQLFAHISNPDLAIAFTKEKITLEEQVKVNYWLVAALRAREYEWFSYKNGMIDEEMFKTYSGIIPLLLQTPRARKWWGFHSNLNEFNPEFVRYVNNLLTDEASTALLDSIKEL